MNKEACRMYIRRPITLKKTDGFILDGVIVRLIDDVVKFETKQHAALFGISDIQEIRERPIDDTLEVICPTCHCMYYRKYGDECPYCSNNGSNESDK